MLSSRCSKRAHPNRLSHTPRHTFTRPVPQSVCNKGVRLHDTLTRHRQTCTPKPPPPTSTPSSRTQRHSIRIRLSNTQRAHAGTHLRSEGTKALLSAAQGPPLTARPQNAPPPIQSNNIHTWLASRIAHMACLALAAQEPAQHSAA